MQIENTRPANAATRRRRVAWGDFQLLGMGALILPLLMLLSDEITLLALPRLLLGLAWVLFVPGYCITAAIFPSTADLNRPQRLALNVGLSIALVPLLALLLDRTPWGITTWPILVAEYAVMLVAALVAIGRRASLRSAEVYQPDLTWWSGESWRDRRGALLIGLVVVLVALAGAAAVLITSRGQAVTEFYALGSAGLAQDYPRAATTTQDVTVQVGINNREATPHTYRVEVWVADAWASGRRELVARPEDLALAAGEQRELPLSWRMPWAGANQQVELLLFADDGQQPYRRLSLWLDVADTQAP